MLDVLCLGTVSIDLYYKGDALTEGKERFELAIGGKYYTDHFYEGLGGGGANVAIGVAKQGLASGLFAKIGKNPFMPLIFDKLRQSRVVFDEYCDIESTYTNISSILLTKNGEKTIINYRTPHQKMMSSSESLKRILDTRAVYMANLSTVPFEERIEILKFAQSRGIITFANLNVTDCRRESSAIEEFLSYVDVFIINAYEFADMVKVPHQIIDFRSKIVSKYAPFLSDKLLIITDGKNGSYAYKDNSVFHQEARSHVTVLDTTGAGDGYTAGFISDYVRTKDILSAMKKGSDYACKILSKIGAN